MAEEKGTITGTFIKSMEPEGMVIEFSVVGEIKGFGRFPNAKCMGTVSFAVEGPKTTRMTGQGKAVTQDGETMPWRAFGISKRIRGKPKDVTLMILNTSSQKYAWVNESLFVLDEEVSADFTQFSGTVYEWKWTSPHSFPTTAFPTIERVLNEKDNRRLDRHLTPH